MSLNQKRTILASLLIAAALLLVIPLGMVKAQTATISVSPSSNNVTVGQTLTVHIVISNVQNLYGVDIGLTWDTSMLSLKSNQSFVGVSGGVLNPQVYVQEDIASQQNGEYDLVATSESPAGPWAGTATITTLTFTVSHAGQSSLTLKSSGTATPELASYPQSGQSSELIPATVTNSVITATTSSTSPSASSSPTITTTTSSSPTSSPSSSTSPTPTPKIPEFPALGILGLLILISSALLLPKLRKQTLERTPLAS